jgi:hypothetical protein
VEQGVVDGHGAQHTSRPAPTTAAFAVRSRDTPDDDSDTTVLRVGPAMERALTPIDDADYSRCSEDGHTRISRATL